MLDTKSTLQKEHQTQVEAWGWWHYALWLHFFNSLNPINNMCCDQRQAVQKENVLII